MEQEYQFWNLERKWQEFWQTKGYFKAVKDETKKKHYTLVMFPYPSGKIHIGHVRNYTIGDIIARTKKMQGFNVLHPIGWDSFGLPAENAAIDNNIHPAKWTFENIDYMRSQLKKLGISYDWDRELATCTPEYYKWNQWLFLKMYEKGLVEKRMGAVNWCERCATVLANEQVEEGKCWRCNSEVEPKELSQWYFKITHYAQQLLDDHEELEGHWPERVLAMQKNWIGRSVGLKINFKLDGADFPIYTTRPDTIFGVTYMAIAPEHPLVKDIIAEAGHSSELTAFVDSVKKESKIQRTAEGMDKRGIFTGKYVEHPFTGDKIPLYIADFVLMDYGTGAIMAVPAHDERDFQFAKKYDLPIKIVIEPKGQKLAPRTMTAAYVEEGFLVHSGEFDGLPNREAMEKIIDKAAALKLGDKTVNYRLKDWLLSRQRYWGTPIPMVYCDVCGVVGVPEKDLPVILPEDVDFSKGGNPLATSDAFMNVPCPKCGKAARRESDTMDTFVDSSWYYARYCDPKNSSIAVNPEEAGYWLNVDQYVGGIEHAVMHLLYSRFFHKVMRDLGLVNSAEPFKRLLTQGMVVAHSYFDPETNTYFPPSEVGEGSTHPKTGKPLVVKMDKMSKSKKNGMDPDDLVNKYGADTVRVFMLFASPPEKDLEWSDTGVEGAFRFIKRIYALVNKYAVQMKALDVYRLSEGELSPSGKSIKRLTHKTIQKVTRDFIERYHFNTGIAALMEFLNGLSGFNPQDEKDLRVQKEGLITLLQLLFPVAPHVAEELYHVLDGQKPSLYDLGWPEFDVKLAQDTQVTYVVQVNGKVRGSLECELDLGRDEVIAGAKNLENVAKYIEGATIQKEIFVAKKLVNFVVK